MFFTLFGSFSTFTAACTELGSMALSKRNRNTEHDNCIPYYRPARALCRDAGERREKVCSDETRRRTGEAGEHDSRGKPASISNTYPLTPAPRASSSTPFDVFLAVGAAQHNTSL